MRDIQAVRRHNLRLLIEQRGGTSSLAKRLGHVGPSFLSQMTTGKRPVSEKTARAIERELGVPQGWFDVDQGDFKPSSTDEALVTKVMDAVADAVEASGAPLGHRQFVRLVGLVYEETARTGVVDRARIDKLVGLFGGR